MGSLIRRTVRAVRTLRLAAVIAVGGAAFTPDAHLAAQDGEPPEVTVRAVEIRGLGPAFEDALDLDRLPLTTGDPYTQERLDAAQRRIREALAEAGYPWAVIEVGGEVDEVAGTALVIFDVEPGPPAVFGPITVQTQPPIREEDVRRLLEYAPGDPWRPERLRSTVARLYELPIVESATITPVDVQPGDTVVPTVVTVTATRRRGLELEGTVSSVRCLQLAGFWRDRYFLGRPRHFSLGIGFSNLLANELGGNFPCTGVGEGAYGRPDYFVTTELIQPWRGDPRTAVLLRGSAFRESWAQTYVRRGFGARGMVSRRPRTGLELLFGYAPEWTELDGAGIYFCGNFGACTPEAIDRFTGSSWLSPLDARVAWTPYGPPGLIVPPPDRRQPSETLEPVDPEREGVDVQAPVALWRPWVRAGFEGAATPTGSDFSYVRGQFEGAITRPLGFRFELAGRSRIALLGGEDVLPPQVRFYSGGLNTVRGVGQNLLGPKFLTVSANNVAEIGCDLVPNGCPPGLVVDPDRVGVRPTGGDAVIEANAEARAWVGRRAQVAAFVDYGILWRNAFTDLVGFSGMVGQEALVTPGVGVRVLTPIGPIRLDVAYDPSGARTYPLFTEDPATGDVIFLGDVVYDPYGFDDVRGFERFIRRLQLQVAVGQPF